MQVHTFERGASPAVAPLLLLHGSDGSEADLLPLAHELAPGASRLALRGRVRLAGGYAHVRRFPDRRVDVADLEVAVHELASFIEASRARSALHAPPVAVAYSNGAVLAAALLLRRPGLLGGAILLRPLLPFPDDPPRPIGPTPVLVVAGEQDERRSPGDGERLAEHLRLAGAQVTSRTLPIGHAIAPEDLEVARAWLAQTSPVVEWR